MPMSKSSSRGLAAAAAFAVLSSPSARAKVIFTGYGDIQATTQSRFKIDGPPSVLNSFNLGSGRLESRGMTIDAIGLFATTSIAEDTQVLMDVTYRDVGVNTRTIRIQYAYIEHFAYGSRFQAGKITLPFGWYNQNRFYGFQRASITGPVFQSGILGLPMSDIGVSAKRTVDLGGFALTADVYAVNGYSTVPGSTASFRNAGLPGGLTIANNIGSRDANHRIALGGRVDVAPEALSETSAGVSYYRGEWGAGDARLLQMAGAHARARLAGFDLNGEYLYMRVRADEGLVSNFGSKNWRTDGFFIKADYTKLTAFRKPLTVWARFEDYFTHGDDAGRGREALWAAAAGAAVRVRDGVVLKAEASDLYYKLPYQGLGDLKLSGYSLLLGLTVTY
ncbi:MAG: hypothetical protein HYV14_00410 [Elusimicrobia bacterium]|nr:hypothetical protein [Elusimicrobiota bacterium]